MSNRCDFGKGPSGSSTNRCTERATIGSIYCAPHKAIKIESVRAMGVVPATVNLTENRQWFRPRWQTQQ